MLALLMVSGARAQWVSLNSGTTHTLNSVYFTDVNTGYAVGDSGTILKTSDGGLNWISQYLGISANVYSVHFPVADTGYAGISYYTFAKTTDGGLNWIILNYPPNPFEPFYNFVFSIFFTDSETGYNSGSYYNRYVHYDFIQRTTNGGDTTWETQYWGSDWSFNSIFFPEKDTGFAVGCDAAILHTTNGVDWVSQSSGTTKCLNSVYFFNVSTGYIVGDSGIILKTTDGGINWTFQNSGGWNTLHSVRFFNESIGYAVGDNGTILKTCDGGNFWLALYSGTSVNLYSVFLTDADTVYVVGQNGTILKTTTGGLPLGTNNQSLTKESIKIFPNPSSSIITISTPTTSNKNTFMTIYNISGQVILSRQITEPIINVDVAGLPQGVYFVKVTDDRTVQVGKFVKQ